MNPEKKELSLGEILKSAREEMNKSEEEIANILRIKKRDIIALEKNDSEFLTTHFYITSLIKSYGKLLNLNNELLEKKIAQLKISSRNKNYRLINIGKKNIHSPNQKVFTNAILIFILLYLIMFCFHHYNLESPISVELIIKQFSKIN